jgi:hypothetical protein
MSIDSHDSRGRRGNTARRSHAEIKRTAYVFANSGLIGLVSWIYRSELSAAAARYVTGPIAATVMALSLVLLAIGNNFHIAALGRLAVASLLLTPLVFTAGWIRRSKEAYWAAAHGRDTEAFRAEIEADERQAKSAVGTDDWLVYPPWREQSPEAPRFGRREG